MSVVYTAFDEGWGLDSMSFGWIDYGTLSYRIEVPLPMLCKHLKKQVTSSRRANANATRTQPNNLTTTTP